MSDRTCCSFDGCTKRTVARGLCRGHYSQQWNGKPLAPLKETRQSAPVRFFTKVAQRGDCWVWTGAKTPCNYGNFGDQGKTWRAHRWSYEYMVGPIPDGLQLDHLCRNRLCVNPAHLDPVPSVVNNNRVPDENRNQPWERCSRGHLLDEANTYVAPKAYSDRTNINRTCKTCRSEAQRRHRERKKARAA